MQDVLGQVFLPSAPGTPVGRFQFIASRESGSEVEVGTPVAADTSEGTVVGMVVDMRTVGTQSDAVAAELAGEQVARLGESVVAEVQVLSSARMRPVRAGKVRPASAEEIADATGASSMRRQVPAGVLQLGDGGFAPVSFDFDFLLGPQAAHLLVGGLSGLAAKTSYMGVLLASALAASSEQDRVAALIFNVKGEDLIYLDQDPEPGYELSDTDRSIYAALGVPSRPFQDVTVYAPGLPASSEGTLSPREGALRLGWDLTMSWPYLRHFLGEVVFEDEKVASFLAEFDAFCLKARDPLQRITTFNQLESWFSDRLREAEESESQYAWRSHHKATVWRIRRMLMGLRSRSSGLLVGGSARSGEDIQDEGWRPGQVVVVDIAGLPSMVQSVVIARTVERLMSAAEAGRLGADHLVVMADELNTFAPSQGSEMHTVRRVLQKVSTQGRYAGISLWGAGQKLSKIDELVRDNAASRALGMTAEGELSSGVYGRMPQGLTERVATLPKGFMLLSHHSFRAPLVVRFPRPAWRTGRSRTTGGSRPMVTSALGLSGSALGRLSEGVPDEVVAQVMASHDDADAARAELERIREPDMRRTALHERSAFDPENPFDLA